MLSRQRLLAVGKTTVSICQRRLLAALNPLSAGMIGPSPPDQIWVRNAENKAPGMARLDSGLERGARAEPVRMDHQRDGRALPIPKREILRLIRRLHELRLIELRVPSRVRLLTAANIEWRNDGPVRQAYQKYVVGEFFDSPFGARNHVLHFDSKELSASSIAVMTRKIDRLLNDFNELAEIDVRLVRSEKQSIGMVLAIRPYALSLFTELKRKKVSPTWPTI
jgi:hypothetical protein